MTDAFIEAFLATFDDSHFPADFLTQYEVMECLSHNDVGETFLVKDWQTGDFHVAKCFSRDSLLLHTAESDLLKKLHHAGLPGYIGEFQNEAMRCIVFEYAYGKPLDKLVQEKPLTRQQAIGIALQLCEILAYLHGQTPAIIHRDIKPQNIIVDAQGNITLIDFGISRIYDETAREDTYNFGTRHYAAPEQYGFSQTDCRSDIYSLGVLLCWLLTGKTEVQQAKKAIQNPSLEKIIERCTAFAPKDRYKSAAQARDALSGRTRRRNLRSFGLAALIILAAAIFFANTAKLLPARAAGIQFKEPLIEQAVRLALNKDAAEKISEQDLLSITELFVFGDQAAASEEAFNGYVYDFVNNTGIISRGSISVLDDLTKLKNLHKVSLCYQTIVDLTPLAELDYLDTIDLRHNPIQDISPLSELESLESLCLFDTNVSDLSILRNSPRLTMVDVGLTPIRSTTAFAGLTSLRKLVIRKASLRSLEQIEDLPMLEQIYLSETQLTDLSPLLDLPRLELVEVDESMRKAAEAVAETAHFSIVYQ